jgi:hypothetical protein
MRKLSGPRDGASGRAVLSQALRQTWMCPDINFTSLTGDGVLRNPLPLRTLTAASCFPPTFRPRALDRGFYRFRVVQLAQVLLEFLGIALKRVSERYMAERRPPRHPVTSWLGIQ